MNLIRLYNWFKKASRLVFFVVSLTFWTHSAFSQLDDTLEKGLLALKQGNYEASLEYLGVAATNQNAEAQYTLGLIFRSGIGVQRNFSTALRWFEAAGNNNHSMAQFVSSWMYRTGTGTKENKEKSF